MQLKIEVILDTVKDKEEIEELLEIIRAINEKRNDDET
jgi:hypothetical protein